ATLPSNSRKKAFSGKYQVDQKIAIDRFRVTKYIGRLMDEVRRQENRELRKQGMENLIGTKHDWPTNEKNMSVRQKK
ncbi:MAG: transposase, partial [Bacteroidota bacterium]|nr:transposase [Bacteroidota bacterium]MXW14431.1 transposase [Rhodothermaceae bacterium]MXW31539.1 transposase [Rhodothermaceae bacterium]MYC05551.1 transposase [Rhodothermaceae bacterium]MYE63165.1 transposase [Rhodothermaceae bacterium]